MNKSDETIIGVKSDYGYDPLNRLTGLMVTDAQNDKLFEQSYTLESDGRKDYAIEKRYDGVSETASGTSKIDWTYDALDRLTGESRDEGMNGQSGGTHDYTATYAFDLSNNRVSKVQDGYQAATTSYVKRIGAVLGR